MKTLYRSSLPCVVALMMVLASCAPKYGAHFAPSKHAPRVVGSESHEVKPLLALETAEAPAALEERAQEAGASEVITDHSPVAELPVKQKVSAKEQRKAIRALRDHLKGMSISEREEFKNQVLQQLKQQQALTMAEDDQEGSGGGVSQILLVILAILIPPLAVFLHQGEINTKFWISLVLTLLFFVPGVIYSLLVVFDVV